MMLFDNDTKFSACKVYHFIFHITLVPKCQADNLLKSQLKSLIWLDKGIEPTSTKSLV